MKNAAKMNTQNVTVRIRKRSSEQKPEYGNVPEEEKKYQNKSIKGVNSPVFNFV